VPALRASLLLLLLLSSRRSHHPQLQNRPSHRYSTSPISPFITFAHTKSDFVTSVFSSPSCIPLRTHAHTHYAPRLAFLFLFSLLCLMIANGAHASLSRIDPVIVQRTPFSPLTFVLLELFSTPFRVCPLHLFLYYSRPRTTLLFVFLFAPCLCELFFSFLFVLDC